MDADHGKDSIARHDFINSARFGLGQLAQGSRLRRSRTTRLVSLLATAQLAQGCVAQLLERRNLDPCVLAIAFCVELESQRVAVIFIGGHLDVVLLTRGGMYERPRDAAVPTIRRRCALRLKVVGAQTPRSAQCGADGSWRRIGENDLFYHFH